MIVYFQVGLVIFESGQLTRHEYSEIKLRTIENNSVNFLYKLYARRSLMFWYGVDRILEYTNKIKNGLN